MEKLQFAQTLIRDADLALKDKSRKIIDSPLKASLLGTSIAISTMASAGMLLPGIGPIAGIAAGVWAATQAKQNMPKPKGFNSQNQREVLYKDAIAKQTAIIEALKEEANADKERIKYLTALLIHLQEVIKELQDDLEQNNPE